MKYARALQDHMYSGKRRRVGDIYPVRRADYQLFEKLGRIEIVPNPAEELTGNVYLDRSMHAESEAPRVKRKYTRRKKAVE